MRVYALYCKSTAVRVKYKLFKILYKYGGIYAYNPLRLEDFHRITTIKNIHTRRARAAITFGV